MQMHSNQAQLKDIPATWMDQNIVYEIAQLFLNDGLNTSIVLKADSSIMKKSPWDSEDIASLNIFEGENTIWFSQLPKMITVNDEQYKNNPGKC